MYSIKRNSWTRWKHCETPGGRKISPSQNIFVVVVVVVSIARRYVWRECYHVESRTLLYMLQKENIYSNFYFIIESLFAFRISYLVTRLTCMHTRTFASRRKNKILFFWICTITIIIIQYVLFVFFFLNIGNLSREKCATETEASRDILYFYYHHVSRHFFSIAF